MMGISKALILRAIWRARGRGTKAKENIFFPISKVLTSKKAKVTWNQRGEQWFWLAGFMYTLWKKCSVNGIWDRSEILLLQIASWRWIHFTISSSTVDSMNALPHCYHRRRCCYGRGAHHKGLLLLSQIAKGHRLRWWQWMGTWGELRAMSSWLPPSETTAPTASLSQGCEGREKDGWSGVGCGTRGRESPSVIKFNPYHPIIKIHNTPLFSMWCTTHHIYQVHHKTELPQYLNW